MSHSWPPHGQLSHSKLKQLSFNLVINMTVLSRHQQMAVDCCKVIRRTKVHIANITYVHGDSDEQVTLSFLIYTETTSLSFMSVHIIVYTVFCLFGNKPYCLDFYKHRILFSYSVSEC